MVELTESFNQMTIEAEANAMSPIMPQQAIGRLMTLARDSSEDGRTRLVTELATLCDRSDVDLNSREQIMLNDIVDELVSSAQPVVRQKLAEYLAPSASAPRRLIMTLAGDQIEVSRPILSKSPILTDSDLVTLVVTQGIDHARAIAIRASIGEAVVDALVVTGDITVMQSVAENMGAKISPKAMTALVNAARFAERLCQPVLDRPEMTVEKAAQLYWWIAPEMRRAALQRFGVAVGQAEVSLEQTIDDLLTRYELDKNEDHVMQQVADWLMERDIKSAKTLAHILRLGHFRLFSIVLSRLIDLPLNLTDIVITEMGGRSLAVVCRALAMEKPNFVSIFLLSRGARGGEQIVHPRELNNALLAFDRLNPTVAEQLLTTWRQDPSYLLDRAKQGALN